MNQNWKPNTVSQRLWTLIHSDLPRQQYPISIAERVSNAATFTQTMETLRFDSDNIKKAVKILNKRTPDIIPHINSILIKCHESGSHMQEVVSDYMHNYIFDFVSEVLHHDEHNHEYLRISYLPHTKAAITATWYSVNATLNHNPHATDRDISTNRRTAITEHGTLHRDDRDSNAILNNESYWTGLMAFVVNQCDTKRVPHKTIEWIGSQTDCQKLITLIKERKTTDLDLLKIAAQQETAALAEGLL